MKSTRIRLLNEGILAKFGQRFPLYFAVKCLIQQARGHQTNSNQTRTQPTNLSVNSTHFRPEISSKAAVNFCTTCGADLPTHSQCAAKKAL
jgi:hypothetical protein